jgi:hypothetical protein
MCTWLLALLKESMVLSNESAYSDITPLLALLTDVQIVFVTICVSGHIY